MVATHTLLIPRKPLGNPQEAREEKNCRYHRLFFLFLEDQVEVSKGLRMLWCSAMNRSCEVCNTIKLYERATTRSENDGVVSFDFYCKHKSITFISLANGYCFLHIASFANHRSICTLSWCALGESSNLCPLAWNDKKKWWKPNDMKRHHGFIPIPVFMYVSALPWTLWNVLRSRQLFLPEFRYEISLFCLSFHAFDYSY